jgi:hypothetical protein
MRAPPRAGAVTGQPRGWRPGRAPQLVIVCLLALPLACVDAQAATYFRSAATAQTGSGESSIVVKVPAGVVAGDVMIATIDAEGGGSYTVPGGWSSTGLFSGAAWFGFSGVYFHVAGAGEPASYSWGLGSSRKAIGKIVSYVGVENGSPIEVTPAPNAGENSGTNNNAPSVTTTVNNTMVLMDFGGDASGSFTITPPGSTATRASIFTAGGGSMMGSYTQDFTQASAGATGTKTFKTSVSVSWGAITIALKPGTGTLGFDVAPATPALPTVTLNGEAQKTNAKMNDLAVDDTTGSSSGWNVTVKGDTSAGKSPVFKQYCSNGAEKCGADAANAYVGGGRELPADSLQLNTTGASWSTTGGSGTAPAFQCNSPTCPVDASSATKIVSTASGGGLGPWSTSGLSASSLALSTPTTMYALPANEVYRVNLLWTLATGP